MTRAQVAMLSLLSWCASSKRLPPHRTLRFGLRVGSSTVSFCLPSAAARLKVRSSVMYVPTNKHAKAKLQRPQPGHAAAKTKKETRVTTGLLSRGLWSSPSRPPIPAYPVYPQPRLRLWRDSDERELSAPRPALSPRPLGLESALLLRAPSVRPGLRLDEARTGQQAGPSCGIGRKVLEDGGRGVAGWRDSSGPAELGCAQGRQDREDSLPPPELVNGTSSRRAWGRAVRGPPFWAGLAVLDDRIGVLSLAVDCPAAGPGEGRMRKCSIRGAVVRIHVLCAFFCLVGYTRGSAVSSCQLSRAERWTAS
ncbi:hypothetical protein BDY21DRAFT_421247 [Lineolata rhizophorae]|uniref:Uncharacterized protein n=1 Tax=Lineolata rhizophorae TaxID=578093 RepID=A0A6A6P1S0_9PEZI|nr:hypothetical protein BDY21DRAFT_421247 [Lineolata rhizophorae]